MPACSPLSFTVVTRKMTRFFVTALIVVTIYVAVECLAQSQDDAEPLTNQKDDSEVSEGDDTDRMGAAQAYASVTRLRPGLGKGIPLKFVTCYSCVDCPRALANTTAKYCPYTNDPTKNSKCVVYAEKYSQMKKIWYVRGCASERGSCADIKRGHDNTPTVKMTFCNECEGDRCNTNGVSRSTFDYTIGFFVMVLCPVFGKYILSCGINNSFTYFANLCITQR